MQHSPGNGQQLLLTGGDGRAVGQNGIKALGQGMNEFVQSAGTAYLFQLVIGNALHVVHQVFPHRGLKQPGILQHHAEQAVHLLTAHIGKGRAVNGDAAAVYLKEAHQQVDHGGFARAGGADNGDLLAGLHPGGEVFDNHLVRGVGVAEAHMVKGHLAPYLAERHRLAAFVRHFLALQKVEDAMGGRGRGLHIGHALGNLGQGGGKQAHIQDEGHNHAKLDGAVHGQNGAHHAHRHIGDVANDAHQGLHHAG